ncbi:hypothetical protein [Streptomyces monashensis]|uniref:hypothetical protein n=1 Tax=Streptomyces monashensis TaxID=1678012 RepID=UPI003F53F584
MDGPDEVLLEFLSRLLHPEVQSDIDQAAKLTAEFNRLPSPDGWPGKPGFLCPDAPSLHQLRYAPPARPSPFPCEMTKRANSTWSSDRPTISSTRTVRGWRETSSASPDSRCAKTSACSIRCPTTTG